MTTEAIGEVFSYLESIREDLKFSASKLPTKKFAPGSSSEKTTPDLGDGTISLDRKIEETPRQAKPPDNGVKKELKHLRSQIKKMQASLGQSQDFIKSMRNMGGKARMDTSLATSRRDLLSDALTGQVRDLKNKVAQFGLNMDGLGSDVERIKSDTKYRIKTLEDRMELEIDQLRNFKSQIQMVKSLNFAKIELYALILSDLFEGSRPLFVI